MATMVLAGIVPVIIVEQRVTLRVPRCADDHTVCSIVLPADEKALSHECSSLSIVQPFLDNRRQKIYS